MNLRILILTLFFCSFANLYAQNKYELDLRPQEIKFKPTLFYIDRIVDERLEKSDAGQVLVKGKSTVAVFKQSLEEDLRRFVDGSVEKDTTKIGLTLSISRFSLKETGTLSNHTASIDFSIRFKKFSEEKSYVIYEISGKPSVTMRGPYPNAHERNISESVLRSIENFDEWLTKNPDQLPLAKTVQTIFDSDNNLQVFQGGDTICWLPNYKLNWDDFKGKPKNSGFMAESNCVFTFRAEPKVHDFTVYLHLSLYACFEKNSSWVMPEQKKEPLLAHEQLHFDICELYKRKLQSKLSEAVLDPMNFDSQIQTIFKNEWEEYQLEQKRYDDETEHGIISEKQKAWEISVKERLGK